MGCADFAIFMNGNDLKFIFINCEFTKIYELEEFSASDFETSFDPCWFHLFQPTIENALYDANSFCDSWVWDDRNQMDKSDILKTLDKDEQDYSNWRSKSSLSDLADQLLWMFQ